VKIWSKLQNKFILEYKSSWVEEINENNEKKPILFIQMTLCQMSLKDALEKIDKELKQSEGLLPFGVYNVSELFLEIINGVEYLHIQNDPIIHRDLNLDNILFVDSNDGYFIKICDFGLSTLHQKIFEPKNKLLNESSQCSKHTADIGTIAFAAPEVLNGGNYDTKSDMYSLGVILKELLCLPKELVYRYLNQVNAYILL
jgi:serine/threonine protein kinase